jgi:cytochrome oxidase Cu insertion factor (SCO1/SenC/PrrC family)
MPEPPSPQGTPSSRRRTIAILAVVGPLALGLLIAVIAHLAGGGEGGDVSTPTTASAEPNRRVAEAPAATGTPAPRIRLDEGGSGKRFDSAALGTDPYAVVFISTACGPIGDYLGRAAAELRSGGSAEAILAISSDPATDTPKTAAAYLTRHHLSGPFHFLLGTEDELRGYWNAWGFTGPAPNCPDSVPAHLVAGSGENAGIVDLDPHSPASLLTDALAGMAK